ncbi:hypothetical protein EMIT0P2_80247 [Pseudomonas sp. IT-P2]
MYLYPTSAHLNGSQGGSSGEGVLPIDNMTATVGLKAKHDTVVQGFLCDGGSRRVGRMHRRSHRNDRADRGPAQRAGACAVSVDLR